MTGRISRELRHRLIDMIQALTQKDSETLLRLIPHLTADVPSDLNHNRLERDLLDLIDSYHDLSLKEIQFGELILSLMNLLNEHRLRIRSDFALMSRAMLALEGLGKELVPNFNLIEEARPLITELVKERWSIKTLTEDLRSQGINLYDLIHDFPAKLQALFRKMDRGDLTFTFKHTGLSALNNTLERISNRVTFGIILAAMIVGSSMIITTGVKPLLFGFPALGVVGYLVSGVLGLWLIVNILRKRKY
jgi:ubiquinone biosynthesis protein